MRAHPGPARRVVLAGSTALVLGLVSAAPAAQATPAAPHHPGSLVLVGGGLKDDNTQIYGEIIKRAGGAKARIGVITAASVPESQDPDAADPDRCSNSACNGAYYAELFTRHGAADAPWIPIDLDHIANADSDRVVAQVNEMTGFFFGGGDQYRYSSTPTPAPTAVRGAPCASPPTPTTTGCTPSRRTPPSSWTTPAPPTSACPS
ncbi:hypothetical protein ACFT0G_09955 [Streptomyces sp. NPDC057020]|uniref:hypothetical protein n=1 Tax=unclassified Streptomyces TaxID=2593676 RepID=UPI003633266C